MQIGGDRFERVILGLEPEELFAQPIGRIAQRRIGRMNGGEPLRSLVGRKRADQLEIALANLVLAGVRRQLQNAIGIVHGQLPFVFRFLLGAPTRRVGLGEGIGPGSSSVIIIIIIVVEEIKKIVECARERESWRSVTERGEPHSARAHLIKQCQRVFDLGEQGRVFGLGRGFRQLAPVSRYPFAFVPPKSKRPRPVSRRAA